MTGRAMVLDRHPGIFCLLATASPSNVVWATSETQALLRISEGGLDLVVLDASVSGIQGLDLLETIRLRAPASEVIVVLPDGQLQMLRQVTRWGADAIFRRDGEIGALTRRVTHRLVPHAQAQGWWAASNRHVDGVLAYLGCHFLESLTVRQIASRLGVSVSHLTHVFGEVTGMTIKELAMRLKIELAKHMLVNGDAPLEELAEQCGFCDASHLSRVFRQFERCRPGEFRANPGDIHGRHGPTKPLRSPAADSGAITHAATA
jgi:AraC-like DNA-binding protein